MDPRYESLADNLVAHSTKLKEGEKALIHAFDVPEDITLALIRAVRSRGAIPFVQLESSRIGRECVLGGKEVQFESSLSWEMERMKAMDAYLALRGSANVFENSDLPQGDMKKAMKILKPVLDWRVKKTKWCVLRWPTPSMAQQAKMSTEAFENFYFDACCMDYSRMTEGMASLEKRMREAEDVKITGLGTDLSFSIKGINAVACGGTHNIPDGEVFSCPVRDSVEGTITYNADTIYQGTSFSEICLKFSAGKIVEATASSNEKSSLNSSIQMKAPGLLVSLQSLSIPLSGNPCLTYSSTRKSPVPFILLLVRLMRKRTTETSLRCIGIWLIFKGPSMAAVRSCSMAN